ncbi:MAG: Gldg family protein [Planctomycetes bacterium]|nr:Gldg family protein [Planctomycetota bacterium]
MTRGLLAVAAALAFLAAALVAGLVPGRFAFDAGRAPRHALDARLARALDAAEGEVVLAWFATAAGELPPGWRDVPRAVEDLAVALEAARPGRVRFVRLAPAEDEDAARFAARLGVRPHGVRAVREGGWSETQVWSALRIADGARGAALVPAVTPAIAPRLQELVAAELEGLRAPRRARVAVAAPDDFLALRARLGAACDVFDLDFDGTARLSDDADLFVWIDPRAATAEHVRELERFLARGGSVWLAGAATTARITRRDGRARLERADAPAGAGARHGGERAPIAAILAHFGLSPSTGVVLEERGGAAGAELALRVASIGEHQDFRALGAEPNGTLFFRSASALEPDAARLDELGLAFRALACSGPGSFQVEPGPEGAGGVDLAEAARGRGRARAGAQALCALLEPEDPWRGALVALGSASPFEDVELADASTAHAALVDVLRAELASSARVVRHAVARSAPPPPLELAPGRRLAARVLVALVPALAALALAVWAATRSRRPVAAPARLLALPAVAAVAVALLASLVPDAIGADLTRERLATLPAGFARLARDADARATDVRVAAVVSPAAELPPELRTPLADVLARVRAVDALSPRFALDVLRPAVGDEPVLAPELARAGPVPTLRAASALDERTEVRALRASVLVASASHAERIDLATVRDAEAFDLAFAQALERALGGPRRVVAFAAGAERLSPAEARLEFERLGRFAPRAGGRFELARAALARHGFELVDADVEAPVVPADAAAIVALAPRRDAEPLARELDRVLARGGCAFVALQPWRLRPIRRLERASALSLWPEPQFPGLDDRWLPSLGLALPREIVSDPRSGSAALDVKLERADGRATLARESIEAPVLVRAAPTDAARDALAARALPELVLPLPARIEVDRVALARLGLVCVPLYATSPAAWSSAWKGGDLGPAALDAEGGAEERAELDRAPLAVLARGSFPGATQGTATGALVVSGFAEAFANDALAADDAAARFLVQSVAAGLLPRDLAELAATRAEPAGLDPLSKPERDRARFALAFGVPGAVLALALLHGLRRRRASAVVGARRSPPTVARSGDAGGPMDARKHPA